SKRVLVRIASSSSTLGVHHVLLDVRDARSELSSTDLWRLAAELSRLHLPCPGKIAVLCRSRGSGPGAFFAMCGRHRGFPVRGFTSFEDAVEWLIEDGPRLLEHVP